MTEAEIEQNHAFVLGIDEINSIWQILEERIATPSVTINCADKTERTFSSIEQLQSYENSPRRQIVRLRISAHAANWEAGANLTFGGYESIRGSISGEDEEAIRIRDKIEDVLAGIKPWFNWLSKVNFFYVALIPIYIAILILGAINPDQQEPISLEHALLGVAILAVIIAALAAIVWGLNRLRRWAFPISTFTIGQGRARHDHLEHVRWVVIIGLVISVAGSAIIAFIL